jgi:hypothetical protein
MRSPVRNARDCETGRMLPSFNTCMI